MADNKESQTGMGSQETSSGGDLSSVTEPLDENRRVFLKGAAAYRWQESSFNGIPFLCRPLPPVGSKIAYFLCLPFGASFPLHKHSKEETVRVIKGKVAIGERVLNEGETCTYRPIP